MRAPSFVTNLAKAFLAGDGAAEPAIARARLMLGRSWRPLTRIAHRFFDAFPPSKGRPRQKDVIQFLLRFPVIRRAEFPVARYTTEPPRMQPVPPAAGWSVPVIETPGDLAAWLGLSGSELDWFADLKGLLGRKNSAQLRHYNYRLLEKTSGCIRLIEAPKPRLKEIQRRILSEILERIPAYPAVHGFLKQRSIRTFVQPHIGRRVILKMDVQDFFPSISRSRIQAMFRAAGYPEAVADLLGGLCSTITPRSALAKHDLYSRPHLPQGAPSSPALSNLIFYRADSRLSGLARVAGATYTRYADDLAFSGETLSNGAPADSPSMLRRSSTRKDFLFSTARRESCVRECASTSPD